MELSVFYCTMHNSIEIFLLLHVIRSCHEMTMIVSYIDSAPILDSGKRNYSFKHVYLFI